VQTDILNVGRKVPKAHVNQSTAIERQTRRLPPFNLPTN
jgi:hypothetical protein